MKKTIGSLVAAFTLLTTPSIEAKKQNPQAQASGFGGQLTAQRVERYLINSFGEVDGLLLANGWIAKFPAHQSDELTRSVRPGDTITATGAANGAMVLQAWTVTNPATQTTLVRGPKPAFAPKLPKHLRAMSLKPLQASGQISHVETGKKGEIKAVILDDGTTLRLGKHAQRMLGMQLGVGRQISAQGVGTQNDFGRALEVTAVSVDGAPLISLYGVPK